LANAFEGRDPNRILLRIWPHFDPIRDDPHQARFATFTQLYSLDTPPKRFHPYSLLNVLLPKEDKVSTEQKDERRATRHGFWFGILVGGLAGALIAGAVAGAAGPVLAAKAFSHGFGRASLQDPEAVRERAELVASFILERVDATEAQQAEVERIVSDTISDVFPLVEEHRANREALHSELSQVDIDADAIERIRQAEMVLAEQASRELTEALTGFAQTLTAEQRRQLMEMGRRFHH
jgi:Spy/CpxP family protein refolding chaperone